MWGVSRGRWVRAAPGPATAVRVHRQYVRVTQGPGTWCQASRWGPSPEPPNAELHVQRETILWGAAQRQFGKGFTAKPPLPVVIQTCSGRPKLKQLLTVQWLG